MRGDCLTCSKLMTCEATSVEKVLVSYTCPLFNAVAEPIFISRQHMMLQYGEVAAVEAMMMRPPQFQEGEE